MTTDPQVTLLSPHLDVTGGALGVPWGQNASGYLVYRDVMVANRWPATAGYEPTVPTKLASGG